MKEDLSLTRFSSRDRASSLPALLERSPVKVQSLKSSTSSVGGVLFKSDSSVGSLRRRVQTEPDSYEHFIETEQKEEVTKAEGRSILNRMRHWLKRAPTKKEIKSQEEGFTVPESATVDELKRKIDDLVKESMEREEDANQARNEIERLWNDRVICLSTLENCTASCEVLISRARVLATGIENGMFHKEDIEQRKDSFVNEIETLKRSLLLISEPTLFLFEAVPFSVSTLVQEGTQNRVPDNQNTFNQNFEAHSADFDKRVEDTDMYASPLEEQLTSIDHSLTALTGRMQHNDAFTAIHGGSSEPEKEHGTEASSTESQPPQRGHNTLFPPIVSQSHIIKTDLLESDLAPECEFYTKATPQAQEFEDVKQKVEFILRQQNRVEQELKTLTQTQQEIAQTTPALLSSLQTQLSDLCTTLQTPTRSAKPCRSQTQDYPSGLPKFVKVLPTNGDCSDIGSKTPPRRDVLLD